MRKCFFIVLLILGFLFLGNLAKAQVFEEINSTPGEFISVDPSPPGFFYCLFNYGTQHILEISQWSIFIILLTSLLAAGLYFWILGARVF